FDFNGVLVDDEPLHLKLFQRVLGEEGVVLSEEDYYEKYLGFDDRDCFMAVLEAAGETAGLTRVMRLITRKAAYYSEVVRREGFPFFPGAVELVREAGAAGLMLGIVSGALRDEVEGALEQAGVHALFKLLVTAEDVKRSKPDPEGYQLGLEGLSSRPPLPGRLVHPHEVLVLEDTPAGLAAAHSLSMTTLGVAQTYPASELAMADAVVESLEGLTLEALVALYEGTAASRG
ncbi:MAG: HAD family phosphatase, partial [Acidobacteria bacterium]|nr:HAD family phosphatase [Acidobacteriota bacterium]